MLGGLARADQRAKDELYLRGLLLDGKRKSMQPMAARLGVDHQQLQEFVTSSTWDYAQVRGRLVLQPHFVMLVVSSLVVAGLGAVLVASAPA